MSKRLLIWGVVLLTVINVASLATIGYHRFVGRRSDGRASRHEHRASLEKELGLSAAQAERMDALRKTLDEQIEPLRAESRIKRERFYQLIMADEPDRMQINAVSGEIDSLQSEIKKLVVDHMLTHREILSSEQQEKFLSLMRKRHSNGYRRR